MNHDVSRSTHTQNTEYLVRSLQPTCIDAASDAAPSPAYAAPKQPALSWRAARRRSSPLRRRRRARRTRRRSSYVCAPACPRLRAPAPSSSARPRPRAFVRERCRAVVHAAAGSRTPSRRRPRAPPSPRCRRWVRVRRERRRQDALRRRRSSPFPRARALPYPITTTEPSGRGPPAGSRARRRTPPGGPPFWPWPPSPALPADGHREHGVERDGDEVEGGSPRTCP